MNVQSIKSYLETNFNFTFYPNGFPEKGKTDCGFVKLTGGSVDKYIKGIKTPSFQIMIRAGHPSDAEGKAVEIYDHFHGKEFFNFGTTYVAFCIADQAVPIPLGKDDNGRTLYSLNFTCKIKE